MKRQLAAAPPLTLAELKSRPAPAPARLYRRMIEDRAIRLGQDAADRLAASAAQRAPASVGVYHGSIDEALELAAKAGLPAPSAVVVQGREAFATGGKLLVPFADGVLVGPAEVVVDVLGKLDEEQCAAMVRRDRELSHGRESTAADAAGSKTDAPAAAAPAAGDATDQPREITCDDEAP